MDDYQKWYAYYMYDGVMNAMNLDLFVQVRNQLYGKGSDEVGEFTISGLSDSLTHSAKLVK